MKLSQKHNHTHSNNSTEFNRFKYKLQRQSDGFGLLTGSSGFYEDHREIDPRTVEQHIARSHHIRSIVFTRIFRNLLVSPVRGIRDLGRHVFTKAFDSGKHLILRQQQRQAIRNALKLSDHYLLDIGVNRADVDLALQTGGNLEQLISHNRKFQSGKSPNVRLIHWAQKKSDARSNGNTELDQAA